VSVARFPIPMSGRAGWVLLFGCLMAGPAHAQTTQPADTPAHGTILVAADEQTLWLARVDPEHSVVYRRTVNEQFQPREPLNAPIASMLATGRRLYAFTEEGAFYSLADDGWRRELDLPHRQKPLDWTAGDGGLYALIVSPAPGQLTRLVDGAWPASSQPFEPGDAALSLVRYDTQGWAGVAACPAALSADIPLPPRIGLIRGTPSLFWGAAGAHRIEHTRLNLEKGAWSTAEAIPTAATLSDFWVATVSRVPTLILAARGPADGGTLSVLRLFGGTEDAATEWRPAPLQLGPLPADVHAAQYVAAESFNQHVVLLMSDASDRPYLQFGRPDAPPAEPSVSLADVFSPRSPPGQALRWFQGSTLFVLVGVLLALFLFRRGAMVKPAILPPECALALAMQRLLGGLIDLAPFALAAGVIITVDWQHALRELSGWAFGSAAAAGKLPATRTLVWWGLSCGGYMAYCLVMELLTRRTIGKVLLGTRVLSENGTMPNAVQIVVRNVFRFLELMPPLWVLGFLVVLSRNRQRLGDIFARTVVVRGVRPAPKNPEAGD
jgi:uncharacterized RDD family membrane protein YckC